METKKNTANEVMHGKGREHIPNLFFRLMTFTMKTIDVFANYSKKHFKTLELKENQIVVDYGCGPARYIKNASEAVGPNGKVFAVDIHPLAIEGVNKKIKKYGLGNVTPLLVKGYNCSIPDKTADVVYALDMFHMVKKPKELLTELARIVKAEGKIIIEDGHQPRSETFRKIEGAGLFTISQQNKHHVICNLSKDKT